MHMLPEVLKALSSCVPGDAMQRAASSGRRRAAQPRLHARNIPGSLKVGEVYNSSSLAIGMHIGSQIWILLG